MQLTRMGAEAMPMSRRTLLGLPLLAALGASVRFGDVPPSNDGGVAMYRGNPARTGEHPGPGPAAEPTALWSLRLGGVISSSPAVVDGVIYVGSVSPGTEAGGALHAVDESGIELWRLSTVPGDGIFSSPAVAEGIVVVGSYDGVVIAGAADTGAERWRFQAETSFYGSPAVVGGTVYLGDTGGHLYALEVAGGEERWRFVSGDGFARGLSSPAVDAGVAYCVSLSRRPVEPSLLHALNVADGSERWRFEPGDGTTLRSVPVVAGGRVHVATRESVVHTVDTATGEQTGRFDLGGATRTELAVVGGVAYIGVAGELRAIDAATGEPRWSRPLSSDDLLTGPTVAGGIVYVGATDGDIYAVDAETGEQLWRAGVGNLRSSPTIVGGVLYVGSRRGYLNAVIGSS